MRGSTWSVVACGSGQELDPLERTDSPQYGHEYMNVRHTEVKAGDADVLGPSDWYLGDSERGGQAVVAGSA